MSRLFPWFVLCMAAFIQCVLYPSEIAAQPSCKTTLECAQAAVTAAAEAQAQVKKLKQVFVSQPLDVNCGGMQTAKRGPYTKDNGFGTNSNKCYISFPQDFPNPTVSLAMVGFNIGHDSSAGQNPLSQNVVNLSVADVSNKGFNVEVASNLDEIIFSVRIVYIVFYQP